MLAKIGSRKFFVGVTALFVLQAAWIALISRYPMAFDEEFHLGLIRLYSDHLSPFLQGQPPGADAFGAVARDPSYLYHYLMSFPYRLIGLFTQDQALQVLILRASSIGLFAWGLVLWRRLLLRSRASSALVNVCLLVFVLIPVVPLLAAQINYDNLLFPLVALAFIWTLDLGSKLTAAKRIDGALLGRLVVLCLLAGLVKEAFLPIFIAIIIYLAARALRTLGGWRGAWQGVFSGVKRVSRKTGLLLGGALLLSLILFGQRYGVNLARYHAPAPDCGKVLSVEQCSSYGPWARNQKYKELKTSTQPNPIAFGWSWLEGMWLRMFFALAGPEAGYQTRGPFVMPGMSAIAFTGAGIVLVAAYGRRVFHKYGKDMLTLTVLAAALYTTVLWLKQFTLYMETGRVVAINGRYLFPVLLPLILLGALSATEFLNRFKEARKLKLAMASLAVAGLLWGGGALTYILRSSDTWYWDNGAVRSVNHAVQDTVGPLVPGYGHNTQYLP